MKDFIRNMFTIFLILFCVGGTALVLCQIAGLIMRNGDFMVKATTMISQPTFVCAAIAGTLGFIYSYFPKKEK